MPLRLLWVGLCLLGLAPLKPSLKFLRFPKGVWEGGSWDFGAFLPCGCSGVRGDELDSSCTWAGGSWECLEHP